MAKQDCNKTCCELQQEVIDLAAQLECAGDENFFNPLIAGALLKLICSSFLVYDAWTPILGVEQQGSNIAFKVIDWIKGTGEKPDIGYLSSTGIVATFAEATQLSLSVSVAGSNVYIGDYELTEVMSSQRLVSIVGNDQIAYADASLNKEAHGLIISGGGIGDILPVYSMGIFAGFAGMIAGAPLYLGNNGTKTLTPPSSGSGHTLQKIGTAKNATNLVLDIEEPTIV